MGSSTINKNWGYTKDDFVYCSELPNLRQY